MADDLNKRALLEIDLDVNTLNQNAASAKEKVAELAKQMRDLKAAGQENTAEYVALQGQQKAYSREVQQAVLINQRLTQAQNQNTGSVEEMRSQLSIITAQYNSLSAEERNNMAVGGQLLTQQRALSDSLKEVEGAGGNATRNVGNYEESIKRALGAMNPFESQIQAVVGGYNSLKAAIAANTAAQEAKIITDEAAVAASAQLTAANAALMAAQEAEAAAQLQITELTTAQNVTVAQLNVAQAALTETTIALAAAQETQSAAAVGASTANTAAAAATDKAATGFKLFDTILKASIIGAIAAIILLLISYLRTFDPLIDKIEQGFAAFNAVLNVVVSAVKNVFTGLTSLGDIIKNIGDFLAHPIDTMEKFGKSMAQAARDAANLKAAQQDLEDSIRINEVKTAETQQRVAELILKARNKSLNNTERKRLLEEAARLDDEDFKRRDAQAREELRIATEQVRQKGLLSKAQLDQVKKDGLEAILRLQGDTKVRGKITDDEVDAYKKAQLNIIAAKDESTKRQEKIQNKIDADAEAAQKAAEAAEAKRQKLRDEAKKQDDARLSAEANTAALSLTGRAAETAKVNADYAKKINDAKGYNATIIALGNEREAALAKLRRGWADQDAKDARTLANLKQQGEINNLKSNLDELINVRNQFSTEAQTQAEDNLKKQLDIEKQLNADNMAFELSQLDLTEQQKALIKERYRQADLEADAEYNDSVRENAKDMTEKRIAFASGEADAVAQLEKQKRKTYSDGLELLQQIFGKQTILGKAAFIAQKALAIAEIAISTQKQIAAINLRAAYEAAQLSLIPIVGPALAAARIIAGKVEAGIALATGIISGALVAATAVQGFDKGGIYTSDGKGGLLPGYSVHDNINSRLRSGEAVIVAEAMRNPVARATVSAINVAYGGRPFGAKGDGSFAAGGIFSGAFATGANQFETQRIIERTALAVANSLPRQILVVEDVNALQSDQAAQVERGTI